MVAREHMTDKFRILIVDDDELVLELMKHVARRNSELAVESTTDSARAIDWIRTREKPYHIIISDLVMPRFSGLDVLRSARTRSPDTLGIIVTGFGDQESTAEAIKLGVSHYLRKPFRREELELAFGNATAHFRLRGQLEVLQKRHGELKATRDKVAARSEELGKHIEEITTRLAEYEAQEKERVRLEMALAKAKSQPTNEVRQFQVLRQLNDLGKLYQHHQISDKEFHTMRKSLLDKAYKSIIM